MKLTVKQIQALQPREREYKVFDGEGLYLLVTPSGGRSWKLKYYQDGKERKISLGKYPKVSLAEARQLAREKRDILDKGLDPREALPVGDSFEDLAREWVEHRRKILAVRTINGIESRLEKHVYPQLGGKRPSAIEPPDILKVVRAIEVRGTYEISNKVYQHISQIFRYAVASGKVGRNPAADISGAIVPPKRDTNFAHLSDAELPDFLRAVDTWRGGATVRHALQFLLLTFMRSEAIRYARWQDISFDKALWDIPKEFMKVKKRDQLVPLSRQAVAILEAQREITGRFVYVFANPDKPEQPISENGMLQAIYGLGYKGRMTSHGARHIASTILHENMFPEPVIDMQMAHVPKGVRARYNKAEYLPPRKEMMQWWADHLDGLRKS
tara:strand:- start:1064 stop:2218 length:1155 start_codon:yes stop_codon:yes gene_type:complete